MKTTQAGRLLDYLMSGRAIDPMQAWSELGIYRLSARVHELREQGYSIVNQGRTVKNRYGEDCKVASYRLKDSKGRWWPTQDVVSAVQGQVDWVSQ